MKLVSEALESTIQETPFNTFSNVVLYDGNIPSPELGGNCTHWLRLMEQKVGPNQLRFVKSAGPHFTAITDDSSGIKLVDPTTLMTKPLDLGPILKDPSAQVSVDAYPFTNGKASKVTALRPNPTKSENRLMVIKEVPDGNRYTLETQWDYSDIFTEDQLPPEAYIEQMTLKQGTLALAVLMADKTLLKIKQKIGQNEKLAIVHGGKRPFTQFREWDVESRYREIINAIASRCNVKSRIIIDNFQTAAEAYKKFTLAS